MLRSINFLSNPSIPPMTIIITVGIYNNINSLELCKYHKELGVFVEKMSSKGCANTPVCTVFPWHYYEDWQATKLLHIFMDNLPLLGFVGWEHDNRTKQEETFQ